MQIKIYTDGACVGNPGPGGWAAIILFENKKKELFGGEKLTTNNRMELKAALSLFHCHTTLWHKTRKDPMRARLSS